jgi:hypothetical protein
MSMKGGLPGVRQIGLLLYGQESRVAGQRIPGIAAGFVVALGVIIVSQAGQESMIRDAAATARRCPDDCSPWMTTVPFHQYDWRGSHWKVGRSSTIERQTRKTGIGSMAGWVAEKAHPHKPLLRLRPSAILIGTHWKFNSPHPAVNKDLFAL